MPAPRGQSGCESVGVMAFNAESAIVNEHGRVTNPCRLLPQSGGSAPRDRRIHSIFRNATPAIIASLISRRSSVVVQQLPTLGPDPGPLRKLQKSVVRRPYRVCRIKIARSWLIRPAPGSECTVRVNVIRRIIVLKPTMISSAPLSWRCYLIAGHWLLHCTYKDNFSLRSSSARKEGEEVAEDICYYLNWNIVCTKIRRETMLRCNLNLV